MRARAEAGFILSSADIRNNIYVPRYYDPRIADDLSALETDYELVSIGELIANEALAHSHGNYVPKMHYGSGPYPYVRTSDISNWEIRASPKHGVSADVFAAYSADQDVQPGDILFVHEGTYLIGTAAMVTTQDGPILYQHHLAKFRVSETAKFSRHYFLAALAAPIVQRQIRARQFSADIIDSVVGRVEEVIIPIARSEKELHQVSETTRQALETRAALRTGLSSFFAKLESLLITGDERQLEVAKEEIGKAGGQTFLGDREAFVAFTRPATSIVADILIPKYYNPRIAEELAEFSRTCDLKTISELIDAGKIDLSTGDEIGRLNYGTGDIPFVRTSDLGTFELKADSKQGVDANVLEVYRTAQNVRPGDILLVRDGTYLVGSNSLIFEEDLPLIFCGGIYKLGFPKPEILPPGLAYALLNLPVVKRQMRSKQFTRDVIDTLGRRLLEVVLPVPKSPAYRRSVGEFVLNSCALRVDLRAKLRNLTVGLFDRENIGGDIRVMHG